MTSLGSQDFDSTKNCDVAADGECNKGAENVLKEPAASITACDATAGATGDTLTITRQVNEIGIDEHAIQQRFSENENSVGATDDSSGVISDDVIGSGEQNVLDSSVSGGVADDNAEANKDNVVRTKAPPKGKQVGSTTARSSKHPDEAPLSFTQKLLAILSTDEYSHIVSWLPHGKGFTVKDKTKFEEEVLPQHFKNPKLHCFIRKLRRWNFTRVMKGPETGAFYHPLFQKGDVQLAMQISCSNSTLSPPVNPISLGMGYLQQGQYVCPSDPLLCQSSMNSIPSSTLSGNAGIGHAQMDVQPGTNMGMLPIHQFTGQMQQQQQQSNQNVYNLQTQYFQQQMERQHLQQKQHLQQQHQLEQQQLQQKHLDEQQALASFNQMKSLGQQDKKQGSSSVTNSSTTNFMFPWQQQQPK